MGVADSETGVPLTTEDIFQIGSSTKQFVAAAILKLQEENKLSIDDSVSKYVPQFLERPEITVRDLLNHSSGLKNYTDIEDFWTLMAQKQLLTLDDIIDFALQYPKDFDVRTDWNYSNTGYIVAGKIIENVSGQAWDEFIRNNFLLELGMMETGHEDFFQHASHLKPHQIVDGKLVRLPEFHMTWALSAGSFYSTLEDLSRWLDIYLEKKVASNLLSQASLNEMTTPFKANYGLGVWIRKVGNDKIISHTGRTPGFVSSTGVLVGEKLKVITLDNSDGYISKLGDKVFDLYIKGKAIVLKTTFIPMSEMQLKEYEGFYKGLGLSVQVFVKAGKLYLQPTDGQPPYEMKAVDIDSFNLEGFAGEEFLRDQNGIIISLKHYQNNVSSIFTKTNNPIDLQSLKNKKIHRPFFERMKSNFQKIIH